MSALLARMSVGARIFAVLAIWFLVLDVIYTITAYGEWAGSVLLLLGALLSGFVAVEAVRSPQDIEAADRPQYGGPVPAAVAETEPPTSSLPSFLLAAGMVVTAAGLPLGAWIIVPGVVMVLGGILGMIDESAR